MPTADKSMAVTVVTMTMSMSFWLIGMSRKVRMADGYFSTDLATFNSLELSLTPAFSAGVR